MPIAMASRKEQKEQARAARLAAEQEASAKAQRTRRIQLLAGVVVVAIAVVVVVIVISSSGGSTAKPDSSAARAASARVNTLLQGIPQSGNVLGNPSAPVTITEYGDLECSVCDDFALGSGTHSQDPNTSGTGIEDEVIQKLVRTGQAKLAYDSLQTATPSASTFRTQQEAAYAAGLQNKAWNFIELFYNEQGPEDTAYVTSSYLDGLAKQVPGLDYAKWQTDLSDPTLVSEVTSDDNAGTSLDIAAGQSGPSTPTVTVSGPKGTTTLTPGIPEYSTIVQAVQAKR